MTKEKRKKYYNRWIGVYNSRSGLRFIHPGIMERLVNIAEEFGVEIGNRI